VAVSWYNALAPKSNSGPFGSSANVIGKRNLAKDKQTDAGFTKHRRDSSNNSGEIYYRSTDKLDVNEYARNNDSVVTDKGTGLAALGRDGGGSRTGVEYSVTRRGIGTSKIGDRQPEAPVRKDNDSASQMSANSKRFGGNRSTILTSARGTLGSTSKEKTLLGG
jgi:hypothetical protein